jgi:hypothetical protein
MNVSGPIGATPEFDAQPVNKNGDISDGGMSSNRYDIPRIESEICSNVLEAHIGLAFTDSFNPGDGLAVFYADQLPFLATKDAETLKEIHKNKLAFGGGRVRQ